MPGKKEANPAWAGLSRFGPVGAPQGHNSRWGRPCSPARANLRAGSAEPSEREHRPQPRNGPAWPRRSRELEPPPAAIRSWLSAAPRGAPGGGGAGGPGVGFQAEEPLRRRGKGTAGEGKGTEPQGCA